MDIMSLLMAKRAGGNTPSGGGSVNSVNGVKPDGAGNVALKYDDLTDRPFYEESGLVEILPETSVAITNGEGMSPVPVVFEIGKTYMVTWNGTEYECEAFGFDGASLIGNPILIEGTDNGMPFTMAYIAEQGETVISTTSVVTGTHTIGIKSVTTTIKTLDPKFLPEGVPYEVSGAMVEILPETSPTYDAENSMFITEGALSLVDGETYIVNWNGTKYTSTAMDMSSMAGLPAGSMIFMGNLGMMDASFPNTGEPYVIQVVPMEGMWAARPLDGTTSLTISIVQDKTTIKKLDNKFLDLVWLPTTYRGFERIWEAEPGATTIPEDIMRILSETDEIEVAFNGENYRLKALSISEIVNGNAIETKWFGNGSLRDSVRQDTGEPFCISMAIVNGVYYTNSDFFDLKDGLTVETFVIAVAVLKYNTLPEEFLPGNATNAAVPVLSGVSFDADVKVLADIQKAYDKDGVARCKYDGTVYSVIGMWQDGVELNATLLLSEAGGALNTSKAPFAVSVLRYNFRDTAILKPILNRTEFYLDSSTANSDKRFKITVDDNGTLSVKEVTA